MKIFVAIALIVCLVKLSEGYLCYECNSTYDKNCFDFEPNYVNYYKGAPCDEDESGSHNCYSVYISDRKVRKFYRGCQKKKICEDYEDQEQRNIQFKVLSCSECNEHYCNASYRLHNSILSTSIITFLTFVVSTLF